MRLVLQTANVVSDAKNCMYPNRVEAGDAAELQEAIRKGRCCRCRKNPLKKPPDSTERTKNSSMF